MAGVKPPIKSWTHTLRLPKSNFRLRPLSTDLTRYTKSCGTDLYQWQTVNRKDSEVFLLNDGPPYANGKLHIGHALNKILKDMVCRVEVQKGKRVVWVPGWDCHGLPIEIKALEKEAERKKREGERLNKENAEDGVDAMAAENMEKNGGSKIPDWAKKATESKTLDAVAVRKMARELASKTVEEQKEEFKEWGIMADWDNSWTTMDKGYEIKQLGVFKEMVKKGLIFRRYKPVYWSPSSQTALAEAELEYNEKHKSIAAAVKFPLSSLPQELKDRLPSGSELSAVIWTTTPWTLPANRAIAVNSEVEYSVARHGSELLLFSSQAIALQNKVFKELSPEIIADSVPGKDIVGAQYRNPLRGKSSPLQPVIHADFVDPISGSGLVHLAPGHGMDDYDVCTRFGIPADAPVDDLGRFTTAAFPDDPPALAGQSVLGSGARKAVFDLLGDRVLFTENYVHKYPYDWRTGIPVIIRATEQWFADVGHDKETAMRYLEEVKYTPPTGRQRLASFVTKRSEWCISRQRAWGVPIPAIYDENGVAVLTEESVSHIIGVIEERGIDAWWTDPVDDQAWILPGLVGTYHRGKDTMDVWFDSGTSWTQSPRPADVYLEGTDQHRGWFQSSLLTHTSASPIPSAPFKTLITHGFTLDAKGKKMSKSLGNIIAPSTIINGSLLPQTKTKKVINEGPTHEKLGEGLGPDALRFWAASSDYTSDIAIGLQVLQQNHTTLIKYRLILKMLLGSMHLSARTSRASHLDEIAVYHLQRVVSEVKAAFENYEFYKAVTAINKYITTDLSKFYLEASKDRLYCGDGGGVFEGIFVALLRMLSPITPHLVEEAWEQRPEWMQDSPHPFHSELKVELFHPGFPVTPENHFTERLPGFYKVLDAARLGIEAARADKRVGSPLEAAVWIVPPSDAEAKNYKTLRKALRDAMGISLAPSVATKWTREEIIQYLQDHPTHRAQWVYTKSFYMQNGDKGTVIVFPATGGKCARCWRRVVKEEDQDLCVECERVVKIAENTKRHEGEVTEMRQQMLPEKRKELLRPKSELGKTMGSEQEPKLELSKAKHELKVKLAEVEVERCELPLKLGDLEPKQQPGQRRNLAGDSTDMAVNEWIENEDPAPGKSRVALLEEYGTRDEAKKNEESQVVMKVSAVLGSKRKEQKLTNWRMRRKAYAFRKAIELNKTREKITSAVVNSKEKPESRSMKHASEHVDGKGKTEALEMLANAIRKKPLPNARERRIWETDEAKKRSAERLVILEDAKRKEAVPEKERLHDTAEKLIVAKEQQEEAESGATKSKRERNS